MWASRFRHKIRVSCVGPRVWTSILGIIHYFFFEYWFCVLLFVARYALNPLTKRNHFGYVGGVDPNLLFSLRKTVPTFIGTNEKRQARLTKSATSTLRELILDRRFESNDCCLFRKPVFLFGAAIEEVKRFYLMGITNGSVKLGSIASSSLTWNRYFHCHTYSPCLFPSTWVGIWSGRSQVSPSGEFLTVLLSLSVMVEKFLHCSPVRWNRSFQRVRPLSKLQLSSVDLWKWRLNFLSLTS